MKSYKMVEYTSPTAQVRYRIYGSSRVMFEGEYDECVAELNRYATIEDNGGKNIELDGDRLDCGGDYWYVVESQSQT